MKDYYIMRISPIHFNQSINLINLILTFSHVKMLKTVTTKQNLNCSPSATFLTARSVLVKRRLRLSLQLSCETGEAISIRKTSLQVWGLLQSSLRFGVSWSVWRASKVSSSPPLTTSLSLCGPKCWPSGRDGGGGQGPNPTNSVSEAMHFPPVCVCKGQSK